MAMNRSLLLSRFPMLTGAWGVGLTLAATILAGVLSLSVAPLTRVFPFCFFFLAVGLSAWFGGLRQGLLALGLAPPFVHFLIQPLWGTPQSPLRVVLWLAFGASIAFMLSKLAGFQGHAHRVLANIAEGVVILDSDWKIIYINQYGAPCASLSPPEMIGRSYWEVAPEARGTVFEQQLRRCTSEHVPVQFEMCTPRRRRWLHVRAYPLPDGLCCFAQDITDAKEREGELRTVLERLATAHQAAQMGTWDWDIRSGESFWSEEIPRIHCIPAEQFDGKLTTWMKTVHPEDIAQVRARVRDALKNKQEYYAEFRVVGPDAGIRWVCSHGRVLVDSQGQPTRMIGMTTDITQRRLEEEALRRSEQLAAAGRLAATIAHEINNPLSAVTNLLYLMRDGYNPEYLRMAEREVARISHIVKQTLGFYRVSLKPMRVNPAELIDDVVAAFRITIHARDVNVETQYRCQLEISAFPNELSQVFGNLVANALEAMNPGGTLLLRTGTCRDGLRVTIADNGKGIPREAVTKIFQPFFTANKEGGTGLGLWLAKEIVERHGGAIRVRSSTGSQRHGTVFTITLPLAGPLAQGSAA
jgi:PAS domain S-box-containing protein